MIRAVGDVMNGFDFEINRSLDLRSTLTRLIEMILLHWVYGKYFEEDTIPNNGMPKLFPVPVSVLRAVFIESKRQGRH